MSLSPQEKKLQLQKNRAKDLRLNKTYGISLKDFNKMLKDQNNACWICKTMPKSGRLCVDHRHVPKYVTMTESEKRKEVRGLLCFQCNIMIGKLERRKTARFLLTQTVKYFQSFKIFGE